ncbi:MAG: hypothetical protein R3217_03970 [Gammaproteobacteria bacterium]|nr:hypothetical protein [Gammaproteobacteria bacterium]
MKPIANLQTPAEHGPENIMDEAARKLVELANQLAADNPEADLWDIADGLLSGAVHYWQYANAPCDDLSCEDCANLQTAEMRIAEMQKLLREFAESSDYFHSPNDINVARA